MACLGMGEADAEGNVNVSRLGAKLVGAGGFINISQTAKKLVFAGTFTAGGLQVRVADGSLRILREGRARKFLEAVQQVTFSGERAARLGQEVLFVTERCVFELTGAGPVLIEIAPGVDLERDILAHMGFAPEVRGPRLMDHALFREAPMDLRTRLLHLDLDSRIYFEEEREVLFLNFEGLEVTTHEDIERLRQAVVGTCKRLGRRVPVVVNYEGFYLAAPVAEAYAALVRELEDNYYTEVSRYTTSAFMRLKLGRTLARHVAPHIFESYEEAQAFHSRDGTDRLVTGSN
jgi:propionate CoA-transferase